MPPSVSEALKEIVSGMQVTLLPTLAEPMLVSLKLLVGGVVATMYTFRLLEFTLL